MAKNSSHVKINASGDIHSKSWISRLHKFLLDLEMLFTWLKKLEAEPFTLSFKKLFI